MDRFEQYRDTRPINQQVDEMLMNVVGQDDLALQALEQRVAEIAQQKRAATPCKDPSDLSTEPQ